MTNHCHDRHYVFSVKKCKDETCCCGNVRLPNDVFDSAHNLPEPIPSSEDKSRYRSFHDSYGQKQVGVLDAHRPSKNAEKPIDHGMPFSPSAQTSKTTKLVANCDTCSKPRCIYKKTVRKRSDRPTVKLHTWFFI